jgi:hypothetical protein
MKTLRLALAMTAAALATMSIGCPSTPAIDDASEGEGEGEGEGEVEDDPRSLDIVKLADALSAFEISCRQPTFQAQLDPVFDDMVIADSAQLSEAYRRDFLSLAQDPDVAVNLGRVNACLAFVASPDATCPVAQELPGEDCRGIFVGRVPPNGVCARSEQCAFGYGCTASVDQCGTCMQRNGEGQPCDPGGCLPGFACVREDNERICRATPPPTPEVGDPCTEDANCGQSVFTGLVCRTQRCAALEIAERGAACDPFVFVGRGTRVCRDTLTTAYCLDENNDAAGVCTDRRNIGDACESKEACNGINSVCRQGTCVSTGQLNDACGPGLVPCTRSLRCDGGTCRDTLHLSVAPPTCEG